MSKLKTFLFGRSNGCIYCMHIHSIHTSYYHDLSISFLYLFYFNPTHPLDYQSTSWTRLIDGCFPKNAVTGADQGTIRNSVREELSETSRLLLRCRLGGVYFFGLRLDIHPKLTIRTGKLGLWVDFTKSSRHVRNMSFRCSDYPSLCCIPWLENSSGFWGWIFKLHLPWLAGQDWRK